MIRLLHKSNVKPAIEACRHMIPLSLQDPFVPALLDTDRPFFIQTDATSIEDSRCQYCVPDCRKAVLIEFRCCNFAGVHVARSIDELFDRDIAVSMLTVEVTSF